MLLAGNPDNRLMSPQPSNIVTNIMYYSRLDLSSSGQERCKTPDAALHNDIQSAGKMFCLSHSSRENCQPAATGDGKYCERYFFHKAGVVFDSKLTCMLIAVLPAIPWLV